MTTTFVGDANTVGWADGTGTNAFFNSPTGVAVDGADNLYVADTGNHTIRKITPAGVVTTLAGAPGVSGSTDGVGSAARFNSPAGLAVDGAGNVYVADTMNFTIRKITPGGVVTTLAGSAGNFGYGNGTGSDAAFSGPLSVAVDGAGTVFVVESSDMSVRKIISDGVVTTFAGTYNSGSTDGANADALFTAPCGVAVDGTGNVYVADTVNNTIRKITDGIVSTIAGTAGLTGSKDAIGSAARFRSPKGLTVDHSGNIYVADCENNTVRKIAPAGNVSTLAGAASGPGSTDATGPRAQFHSPFGLAVDASQTLYVSDTGNHTIRKITSDGTVTTIAGTAGTPGYADGVGSAAQFNLPSSVAVDSFGNIYVADSGNSTIRKITAAGVVTTVAGLAGGPGSADGSGVAARFRNPAGVAVDSSRNVYVTDFGNCTIRKITPVGVVTTLAGAPGLSGFVDGQGAAARFSGPTGLALDAAGDIYVSDPDNLAIRKVTQAGAVTTITSTSSRSFLPSGVALDSSGNVYVSISGFSSTIDKITPDGVVTSVGGNPAIYPGWRDGTGSGAGFNTPRGLAMDNSGQIYVADTGNHTIRKGMPAMIAPSIVSQTVLPYYAIAGGTVTFSVSVAGYPEPTYQWQKDGVNIPGATGASYIIQDVKMSDAGAYRVWLTNSVSSVESSESVLTVHGGGEHDFNNDGHSDILWQNTNSGERFIWSMNGFSHISGASLGVVDTAWSIAATADFNADDHEDILWQNTVTGERYLWLMRGAGHLSDVSLGVVETQWSIAATSDFDGDGQTDILWQNTATGERYIWFMSGAGHVSGTSLGVVAPQWSIGTAADFNGDGHPDIMWQNTVTGQRYLWLMNGAAHQSDVDYGIVDSNWKIVK